MLIKSSWLYSSSEVGSLTSFWWKYAQLGTKFLKGFLEESLGEDVYKHVLGRYIIKFDFLAFNLLTYKIMLNVNILSSRMRYWVVYKCNAP